MPATVSVPAAIVLAAVMLVLANELRVARSVHEASAAPVAALSCGKGVASSSPPQAEISVSNTAAPAQVRR